MKIIGMILVILFTTVAQARKPTEVCNLPEEPETLAQCAVDGQDITQAMRNECVGKILDGTAAKRGRLLVNLVLQSFEATKKLPEGVEKLRDKPRSAVDCLVGEISLELRTECCMKLSGGWSTDCKDAAALKEEAGSLELECK